ncbi:unnamed protein product [Gadus morhua 'NCC']
MVKPQSQHSGGRGVEQAGCSYAGDGEASWTAPAPAPGVISSLAGQQCPDDTFKEDLSGQKLCSACTKCVTGQKVKKFCTPTSDTECESLDGFFCRSRVHRDCTATTNSSCSNGPDDTFKEDLSGQKQCSACTKCVTGQKVKKSCTPTSDAECEIRDGFFCSDSADKDTFSEAKLSCQTHTKCDSVGGTDTPQTSSHGTEQNIQTASSKDTGPAQTSTTPRNSPGINHLVGEAVKAHELSNMDCQPEKQQ